MKRSHDQNDDREGHDRRHSGGDRGRPRYDGDPSHRDSEDPSRRYSDGPGHYGGGGHDDRGGSNYGDPSRRDDRQGGYGQHGSAGQDSRRSGGSSGSPYGPSGGSYERSDERQVESRYAPSDRGEARGYYGRSDDRQMSGPGGSRDHGRRDDSRNYGRDRPDNQGGRGGFRGDSRGGRGGDSRGGGRGGGRGRGGRGRGPDLSGLSSCLTNIVLAEVTEGFQFFLYTVNCKESNGEQMESRFRRKVLFHTGFWDHLLTDIQEKEKKDLRRVVFFSGSYFCSGRAIPGLEPSKLPYKLSLGKEGETGETVEIMQVFHYLAPDELRGIPSAVTANEVSFDFRCADCTRAFADQVAMLQHCQQSGHKPVYVPDAKSPTKPIPAQLPVFVSYVNDALQRALGERLARWGKEFIDPEKFEKPTDRRGNDLGVSVYQAYSTQFNVLKPLSENKNAPVHLALTVDLKAKVVRTMSVLDTLVGRRDPASYKPSFKEIEDAKREWIGQVVIYMEDRKCYSVTDLLFDHSPSSLPVEGLGMYHSEYFQQRKGVTLKYPDVKPMVAVLGRRDMTIYLPAELVAGNELERKVKEQLPMIASYKPEDRNKAIETIRSYLVPGAQKTKGAGGLLPALGVQVSDNRISAKATVLPLPMMMAAGVQVPPHKKENWAPILNGANFNVNPGEANTLNVVVVYHERLERGASQVFSRIRDMVNRYKATYRFSTEPFRMVKAGDREKHWEQVEKTFSDPTLNTENLFVLDFTKPRGALDTAYPVVKQMLTSHGYISQFVNFNTYAHDNPQDQRRSQIILQGVARQILQKAGVRLWWVNIPRELPTPTVFVGVDVFHAPRVYDPIAKKRTAKASCAAIIVQVYRSASDRKATVELYSETYMREAGKEYDLRDALKATVSTALRELDCDPKSCIVWRDGIGDSAFASAAPEEIMGISEGLNGTQAGDSTSGVPMAYVVCQKRIDTKFFTKGLPGHEDGKFAAPSGTLVEDIQGLTHHTFYINGRAPPYSTAKPVRFIVLRKDDELKQVSLPHLTWDMCHDYPNWTGPIKVPSVCQMAHKLAELAGNMPECGRNMNNKALKNKVHFL